MKTIKELLKQTKPQPDHTKVTLTLHVPLKKVRAYAKRFASLGVVNVTIVGGAKAATKKPANAKRATQKASAKRGNTAAVTQAAVLAAIRGKHRTPQAIASAMKANPVQVRKALSRYTQQGLIVRTGLGQYALKK